MTRLQRALVIWLALAGLGALIAALALVSGSGGIGARDALAVLFVPDGSTAAQIVHELRAPRAAAAYATGALLALSGALMQIVLRNPLADPYVLGLSGGAAVAALGAMIAGAGLWVVEASAFGGALVSVGLVMAIAHRDLSRLDASALDASPRLLLTGVVLAALWSALVTLLLTLAPEARLRGMLFWLMGDLGGADVIAPALIAVPLALLLLAPIARDCNVLLQGPAIAHALGVDVARVRTSAYVIASLATAIAVTTAGTIGFVGLVVPHALRLVIGNDQRVLLPASALAGGALLLAADTAARTMLAPQQLPVGVITAIVGVPAFIALLLARHTR